MTKKIGFGLGLWLVLFILTSILIVLPGPKLVWQLAEIVIFLALSYLAAWLFFKKAPADLKSGAVLGLLWVAIYVVIDWLLVGLAAMLQQAAGSISSNYSSWYFYVGLVVLIGGAAMAGKFTHGGAMIIGRPAPKFPTSPFGAVTKPAPTAVSAASGKKN